MAFFGRREIDDLLLTLLFVSLAVTISFFGVGAVLSPLFLISLLTVGIGVVAHELSHKAVARRFGFSATYVAYRTMLYVSVLLSFFVLFLAPGAVQIAGTIHTKEYGKIALAGPVANLVLSFVFFFFRGIWVVAGVDVFWFGFSINALLALFNLLPIFTLDGKKVYSWSRPVYFTALAVAAAFELAAYLL